MPLCFKSHRILTIKFLLEHFQNYALRYAGVDVD